MEGAMVGRKQLFLQVQVKDKRNAPGAYRRGELKYCIQSVHK
jgi:hypothetical protein